MPRVVLNIIEPERTKILYYNDKSSGRRKRVNCPHCGNELSQRNLHRHINNIHQRSK